MKKQQYVRVHYDLHNYSWACEHDITTKNYDCENLMKLIWDATEEVKNNKKCAAETRTLASGVNNMRFGDNMLIATFEKLTHEMSTKIGNFEELERRIIKLVKLILSKSIFRYERLKQIEESKRLIGSRH